jgi:hypothetical protein
MSNFKIFPNQQQAGDEFFSALLKNENPVLCSLPQMGKTGTLLYVVNKILEYCKNNNIKNFKIVHLLHDSNNDVKSQTKKDYNAFIGAGLQGFTAADLLGTDNSFNSKLLVIHRDDLKKIQKGGFLKNITTLFMLSDESHIAINKDGLIDNYINSISISNIYCGQCSATPFPYCTKNDRFKIIVLKPSTSYYGIIDYKKEGRLFKAEPLFNKDREIEKNNPFWKDIVDKSIQDGPGYALIRDSFFSPEDSERTVSFMKDTYNINCNILFFNDKLKNIDFINRQLISQPSDNNDITFIVLKNALRVGKRITKSYIRGAHDTPNSSNGAGTFQSLVGRLSGNDVVHKNFNIYCDIVEIDDYQEWWDAVMEGKEIPTLPSSRFNSKGNTKFKLSYQFSIPGAFPNGRKTSIKEIVEYRRKHNLPTLVNVNGKNIIIIEHEKPIIKTVSKNKQTKIGHGKHNDMAGSIVSGAARSTRLSKDGLSCRLFAVFLDEMNPSFEDSWKAVLSKGYQQGELVVAFPIAQKMLVNEDLLKDNCLLKD